VLIESEALPTAAPSIGAADTPAVPTAPIATAVAAINNVLRIDTLIIVFSSILRCSAGLLWKLFSLMMVASTRRNFDRKPLRLMNIRSPRRGLRASVW
jgi:hypothetical protein